MRILKHIDILDEPADALIYSTNLQINCTGGVGACLVSRYGFKVQDELHALRLERGHGFPRQGDVLQHVTKGMPYRKVFHTMPCDPWYDTSAEIVQNTLRCCLDECLEGKEVKKVAVTALATGYGHLQIEDFLRVADKVLNDDKYSAIGEIAICIADKFAFDHARQIVQNENLRFVVVT